MTAVVTNTKSDGSVLANAAQSLGFTGTSGRTMIVAVWGENSDTVTDVVDSVGGANNYVQDVNVPLGGNGRYFYRCTNFTGAPTSITVQAPTDISIYYAVWEVTGLAASSVLNVVAASTSTTATFTTTADNCIAFCMTGFGGDSGTISATGSTVLLPHNEYGRDAMHILDCGTAGAKTLTYNTSLPASEFNLVAAYNIDSGPVGPTVSTITIGSVTEGGAASVTVALSAATSASTNFACGLAGVTATGVDLTLSLNGVTCTNGVTCDGTNFTVPSGVSGWSFSVQTTADTLDEANETATLTIGGISQTLTITDDDATPAVSVSDATENAGEVVFTVSLSAASGKSITVDYATANGTSTAGVDYTAATGTLTFAAGETTKTVTVTVP